MANEQMLVVSDIEHDPRFADNETIVQWNMRFCAGTRLRAADDLIIGALCVLDSEPRTLGENGVALLEAMAADIACPRRLPVGVGRSVRPTISVRPRMRIANKPVRLAQQAHGLERNMP
ncbi:GAF domain-containing protein [Bradyrhizobium sp. CCBAU 11361]|uniref:GAF domain-containing protein n=1 Tax=Bradyrhizobium sp. CCBAU 11361 TaxID=1630812 RepID=UPI0023037A95|nr:GAF domain-containing protein [Bradyrhizobium sp. CCBAU 11361]